jgi:hypothetical protein
MPERNPTQLADAFGEHLSKRTERGPVSLACESEDESVLVAYRLRQRGWKAEATTAMVMQDNKLSTCDVVRVTGKKKVPRG